jgi:hypothetical protein
MKQVTIFLILFLVFTSCKKTSIHTKKRLKGDNEVLIGIYEWDSTFYFYYIDYCCPTPYFEGTVTPNDIGVKYKVEILKEGVIITKIIQ